MAYIVIAYIVMADAEETPIKETPTKKRRFFSEDFKLERTNGQTRRESLPGSPQKASVRDPLI